jgi:hypothetical protein
MPHVVVVMFTARHRVNLSWCLVHEKLDGIVPELIGHRPVIVNMKPVCIVPSHESDSEEPLTLRAINNNVRDGAGVDPLCQGSSIPAST